MGTLNQIKFSFGVIGSQDISSNMILNSKVTPTLEHDFQLVPQDVKDAVERAGLRDHVPVQPASACVLVKVLARVHTLVHVLK